MQISESFINKLQQHALAEHPNECCGILAGENNTIKQIYPVTNTYRSPYRYLMDPQEQFEAIRDAEKRGFGQAIRSSSFISFFVWIATL